MLNLIAVLPLPNTSYAMPKRGERSLYALTPSVRSSTTGCVLNGDISDVPLCSAGLKLEA